MTKLERKLFMDICGQYLIHYPPMNIIDIASDDPLLAFIENNISADFENFDANYVLELIEDQFQSTRNFIHNNLADIKQLQR